LVEVAVTVTVPLETAVSLLPDKVAAVPETVHVTVLSVPSVVAVKANVPATDVIVEPLVIVTVVTE